MRLINEDDVLEIIERVTNEAVEKKQPKYLIQPRIIAEIAGLPTIEAEPVKHGRWMYPFYCSECGFTPYYSSDLTYNYCPNCGARMDGDSK
jgi:hypothetical protein